jgi:ferrous iron transport protein B
VLFINVLYTFGIIQLLGRMAAPVITGIMGLPEDAVGALIVGFLRKDVAVGMLLPLGLNLGQLVVASVVLTMYFPCVATFAVLIKELGIKDMAKSAAIMFASAVVVGGLLNFLL